MNRDLDEITQVMDRTYGWDVSCYDETFLEKSIDKRLAAAGAQTAAAYARYLAEHRAEAEALFRSLSVTYSEFFRNPLTFAVLEQLVLPRLCESKRESEIRIWSAGCAAGQEAYSVAILLDELAAARGKVVPFRIFASDSSETALEAARKGVYDFAAVQNARLKHIRDYFTRRGESYIINSRLSDRIDFSVYELLDEGSVCPPASIYGDFDLILCSNLLFYYRSAVRQSILDKVCGCLAPNKYLVTGEVEREWVEKAGNFQAVAPPAAVFRRTRAVF